MTTRKLSLFEIILLIKPVYRARIEWPILIIVAVLGVVFSWSTIPFFPYSNIIGGIVLIGGLVFHRNCHKAHQQSHEQYSDIENVVNTGIFSKIRHPMYLSLIFVYFGFAFAWGIVWILLPATVLSVLTVLTAVKEEEFLSQKLGSQYEEYKREVPWRFVPKVF